MTDRGRHDGRAGADGVLLAALVAGSTTAEAAAAAGVSQRTVRRRLSDPSFVRRITQAREEMLDAALAKISAATGTAVTTLVELMSPDVAPSVRLGSARATLEFGLRLRDELELANRLTVVEAHLGTMEGT